MTITGRAIGVERTICGYDISVAIDVEVRRSTCCLSSPWPYRDLALADIGRQLEAFGVTLDGKFDQAE